MDGGPLSTPRTAWVPPVMGPINSKNLMKDKSMKLNRFSIFLNLTPAFLYTSSYAHAASSGTSNGGYGAFWLAFLIIYLTRKRAIGGWLLYYYFTLFGNLFFLIILSGVSFGNFQPSGWDDKALYGLFIISIISVYLLKVIEALIACLLLVKRYRFQKYVNYLRYSLIAQALVYGLTLFIDYNYFPSNVPTSIMGGFLAIVWYFYFSTSYRVFYIFSQSDWIWNYEAFRQGNSARKLAEAEAPKQGLKNFFGRIKNILMSRKNSKANQNYKTLEEILNELELKREQSSLENPGEKNIGEKVETNSAFWKPGGISKTFKPLKLNKTLFITTALLIGIIFIGFILFNKYQKLSVPDIAKKVGQSVVVIHCLNEKMEPLSQGSGFFINENGNIITSYHVVNQNSTSIEITTAKKTKYFIKEVLAEDKDADLIMLSVDLPKNEVRPLSITTSPPEIGEKVVVISSPFGFQQTVSEGIVSATRPSKNMGNIIQITAPISPGSSGAPVVNSRGEIIGIVSFQAIEGQNLNFAISGGRIKKLSPGMGQPLVNFLRRNTEKRNTQFSFYRDSAKSSMDKGDYKSAIEYYTMAISIDQTNSICYFGRGFAYQLIKDLRNALNDYSLCIEIAPSDDGCYAFRGRVFSELGDYQSAIQDFDMAISLKPDEYFFYYQRGRSYRTLGNLKQAFKDFEKAITLNPQEGYYVRGLEYRALGYEDRAGADIKEAARLGNLEAQKYLESKGITWWK